MLYFLHIIFLPSSGCSCQIQTEIFKQVSTTHREQNSKMLPTPKPKTLTPDHTFLRLSQDEYFQQFFRQYLELLKSNLKRIQVMDHNGCFHRSYYTCGQDHDRRNREWKPFQLLERHCEAFGYDFLEAKDIVEDRIERKLICECELLRN